MAGSVAPNCPTCSQPMESGLIGTNGKLVWEQAAGRLMLDGETAGKKVITTVQNYRA